MDTEHETRHFDVIVTYRTGALEVEHFQEAGVLFVSDSPDVIKTLVRETPDNHACWSFGDGRNKEIQKKVAQATGCNLLPYSYGYIRINHPGPQMPYFVDVRRP